MKDQVYKIIGAILCAVSGGFTGWIISLFGMPTFGIVICACLGFFGGCVVMATEFVVVWAPELTTSPEDN